MKNHMPQSVFRLLIASVLFFASLTPSDVQAQTEKRSLFGTLIDPSDPKYRDVADAIVLFQRGNGPTALKLLQEAKAKNPELPPGTVMFAHLCFASGNLKPGREILQVAAVESADDPEVWNMLADLQLREGHLAEAALLFEKAISTALKFDGNEKRGEQQLLNAYAGAALAYERRQLWQQAEPLLKDWRDLYPAHGEVYSRLAALYINTERYEEAMNVLGELRKLDPDQLPAEITLGLIYQRLGKTEQARTSLLTGLETNADNVATQIAVAQWGLKVGDLKLARQCAAAAASLQQDSYVPALIMAQADYLAGNFPQAESAFRDVYQAKPSNFDATNGLALALLAQDEPAKQQMALEYAELLAQSNNDLRTPRGGQAASLLAWALHRNGKQEEALKLMATVLNNSTALSPEIRYFAAVIFADNNQKQIARELLSTAASSSGAFPFQEAAANLLKTLE